MPKLKSFLKIFISLILLLLFVAGCGKTEKTAVTKDNPVIDKDTVVLGAYRHLAPGPKDGMYCSKILTVWEPLITKDDKGLPAPCLAVAWEMKQEGREWIFHLRKGVRFSNGKPFNADAVVKNFDRMSLGYKRSSFYGLNIKGYYPSLISYEKLDEYTIRLLFKEPSVNQLYKMTDFGSPMYDPDGFDAQGNFKDIAVGTGPLKITKNIIGKYVVLEPNDLYYGQKAKVKRFIVKSIPSADVRYAALKAGEILGVLDLNAIPPFLAEEIKKDPRFEVATNKSTMVRFLYINGSKFPFNDIRMRQAVSLTINRDNLVDAMYLNYAVPTTNVLNFTSPYYKQFPVEYDLAKAKKLAKEVIGDKILPITYVINGSDPLQKGEAELIAYWLKDIGLDVTIRSLEYSIMNKELKQGKYHLARTQQGLPNGDPYTILETFMMPKGARNLASSSGYSNKEVIELMGKVKHVADEQERHRMFDRIQEICVQEQPVVPLFYDLNIVANSKLLKNYRPLIYGVDLSKVELVRND